LSSDRKKRRERKLDSGGKKSTPHSPSASKGGQAQGPANYLRRGSEDSHTGKQKPKKDNTQIQRAYANIAGDTDKVTTTPKKKAEKKKKKN